MRQKLIRRVNLIRFTLPFVLFFIVASYESWEHLILDGRFRFNIHFNLEVLFFGIMGPLAVFLAIGYIRRLLIEQVAFGIQLERMNKNLETKVAERTEELAARNDDLAQANIELQKLDQLKSDFVALVSHELRGPLTTLNGGLELALQNSETMPAEAKEILSIMAVESQRLTKFVQVILDVSRLDAGKLEYTPGPVAVYPLMRRATELVCAGKNREIVWHTPQGLPPAWGDESYLEQIMCNLLSNADKYSPPDKPIEISTAAVDGRIWINVVDYGPGISKSDQSLIFERFHRLENGDRIGTPGWGLGLYFSRELARAQGGDLRMQSPVRAGEDHPGSAFTLEIPIVGEVPEDD